MKEALFDSLYGENADKLRRVLREGVDVNQRDDNGSTPLYKAAGDAQKVKLLLEAGADPNAESADESEGTPLCFAACWGEIESVRVLLAHGADPNRREGERRPWQATPLVWAAQNGHHDVARLLLESGANPDLAQAQGRTPLMAAARRGSLGIVRLLLEHGADPNAADDDGQTASDVAEEWAAKDLETELRVGVEGVARSGDEVAMRRTQQPDGTELVAVEIEGKIGAELQTGHAEIAKLLRGL